MESIGKLSLCLAIAWIFTLSNCVSPATRSLYGSHTSGSVRDIRNEIYVKPNDFDTASCPEYPCHTLDWYARNGSALFYSDTAMVFIKGKHYLNATVNASNCSNLSIYGKLQQSIRIICNTSTAAGFLFSNCTNVEIRNIIFEGCGTAVGAALSFRQGIDITLSHVTVKYAMSYGLTINNVFGRISINECSISKTKMIPHTHKYSAQARLCFGSTCGLGKNFSNNHTTKVTIVSSQFMYGHNVSGLEIYVHHPNTSVEFDNITLQNNTAGNLVLTVTYLGGKLNVSVFKVSNSFIYGGQAKFGGGISLTSFGDDQMVTNDQLRSSSDMINILEVHSTKFISNYGCISGGAAYLTQFQGKTYNEVVKKVRFKNCTFINNQGNGAVMEITKHKILVNHSSPALNVTFENCSFHNNSIHNNLMGTIMNIRMSHITMSECNFTNNKGTAVSLRKSNLNFHNNIQFADNKADYGAALKVCEGSTIFLHNNSKVYFINNSASVGGAVFAEQTCMDTASSCIFQPVLPENVSIKDFSPLLALTFVNNSAMSAGDSIYGGSLDRCYTLNRYHNGSLGSGSYFNYPQIFKEIFNMTGQLGPSWISSNPRGVCFCKSDKKISETHCINHPTFKVYPGARFTISAAVVGQFNGTTIGTINSTLLETENVQLVTYHEQAKPIHGCINLTYSIFSNVTTNYTLELHAITGVMDIHTNIKPFSIKSSVSLLPCPLGFQLVKIGSKFTCGCGPPFQQRFHDRIYHGINCNITTQSIDIYINRRWTMVWLGCLKRSNGSVCEQFVVSSDCDYYCSGKNYHFILTSNRTDDSMCRVNREGILCGACKHGYSRVLGSIQSCQKCSNKMLLYLIPTFLLSGILLILLLSVLNITVTEGTINGLMFYATVLYADISVIPNEPHEHMKPLRTFISWVNLHWGFDLCAYDGMDGYQYIWLQLGYVFYLMLIQGFIIFLSRRFIFFTRLFGKNVLKVLATVLFLLHSQLLYACLSIFQPAYLYISTYDKTITKKVVWYYDGNLPYFGFKHAVLFVVALLCMLITTFFMLSLFLTQCLNKWTDYWILHWFCRLRPFYEAFTGPCHNNYHFWPGFLYIMRSALCCLTLYVSAHQLNYRQLRMIATFFACILIMLLACIFPHGVYKKWPLNVLEFSFLLNLCITSIVLGYSHHDHVLFVSVPLVMLTCVGILLFHIYQQCKTTCTWKKLSEYRHKTFERKHYSPSNDMEEEKEPFLPQSLPPVVQFKDFRESLLED